MASAPVVQLLGFFAFREGRELGGGGDEGEVIGVAVHSAGCACSHISSSAGTWGTLTSGFTSDWISDWISPRRTASSSGVGEVLHSPSMGCRSEASTISSPLRTNRGAMHHCSSLAVSHRTPMGQPDSLVWACSTLVKARVLCSLITMKLEEARKDMYCSSWSLGMAGGGAHHPAVLCWARGSQKVTTCH